MTILNFFQVTLPSKLEKVIFWLLVIFFVHILLHFEFVIAKNDENWQFQAVYDWLTLIGQISINRENLGKSRNEIFPIKTRAPAKIFQHMALLSSYLC